MTIRSLNVTYNRTNVRVSRARQSIAYTILNFIWGYWPALSKQIVKKLFFTPARPKITPEEKECLANGRAFEISIHNQKVQCWSWGRGPGILLVHGWNGRGIQFYRYIIPLVRKGYSVITFDGPGHGKSHGKTSSYFELTDTVRFFLQAGGTYNIQGVIAHSLGASAVLNGIAKEGFPLTAVLIAPALRLREILFDVFDGYGVPEKVYRHLIGEFENRFGYDMVRDNPYHLLKRIQARILIVHDRNDNTIPYADSKEAAGTFQAVSLHTTAGLGHKRILSDPSVLDPVIKFIRRNNLMEDKEMDSTGRILEDYREADFEKRLHLFLECPPLRNRFMEIEQSEFSPGECT